MKLSNFMPCLLRSMLWFLSPLRIFRRITWRPQKRDNLHQYWRQPSDSANAPEKYLEGSQWSHFLMEIMKKYVNQDAKILEIGCNSGRNLSHLFSSGFKNLAGIEINQRAVQLLKKVNPEMANCA